MLHIENFVFNPFYENTWVVHDGKSCAVIDPGCMSSSERSGLSGYITRHQLEMKMVLNTHCHIDHIFGNAWAVKNWGVPLMASLKDLGNLQGSVAYARMVGLPFDPSPEPDQDLKAGDVVELGSLRFEVLFTPGHAPGHVSFYHRESKSLFSGDVLFENSIGRTDLPGGNYDTLMKSIEEELLPLPDDVKVYSGHGPVTTIGRERKQNPFIREYLNDRIPGL